MEALLVKANGMQMAGCFPHPGNITAPLHPVGQLRKRKSLGFEEGLCWAACELHSCSLLPQLAGEENKTGLFAVLG